MNKLQYSFFEKELEHLLNRYFEPNLLATNFEEVLAELLYAYKRLLSSYRLIDDNNTVTLSRKDIEKCIKESKRQLITSLIHLNILHVAWVPNIQSSISFIISEEKKKLLLKALLKSLDELTPNKLLPKATNKTATNSISLDIDSLIKEFFRSISSSLKKYVESLKSLNDNNILDLLIPTIFFGPLALLISQSGENILSNILSKKSIVDLEKQFLKCIGLKIAKYSLKNSLNTDSKKDDLSKSLHFTNEEKSLLKELNQLASMYIREVGYKYGNKIYEFMDKFDIGKNYYGKIMDAAAHGKGVIAHRLYGHHFIYDIPIENPQYILQFYEHLFSDLFTRQGLPILPGEILEDVGLLKVCDKLTKNWNFINGFDILTATVSIYSSLPKFKKAIKGSYTINSIDELAKQLGVGAIELAIAISSANPFLLIAAILEITSDVLGIFNKGDRIFFDATNQKLTLTFSIKSLDLNSKIKQLSLNTKISSFKIENHLFSSNFSI